jgi:hypothetical protein
MSGGAFNRIQDMEIEELVSYETTKVLCEIHVRLKILAKHDSENKENLEEASDAVYQFINLIDDFKTQISEMHSTLHDLFKALDYTYSGDYTEESIIESANQLRDDKIGVKEAVAIATSHLQDTVCQDLLLEGTEYCDLTQMWEITLSHLTEPYEGVRAKHYHTVTISSITGRIIPWRNKGVKNKL